MTKLRCLAISFLIAGLVAGTAGAAVSIRHPNKKQEAKMAARQKKYETAHKKALTNAAKAKAKKAKQGGKP